MLPVVSVVPGVRSGVLLGWLPGYDCRPDDSPPDLSPRDSHTRARTFVSSTKLRAGGTTLSGQALRICFRSHLGHGSPGSSGRWWTLTVNHGLSRSPTDTNPPPLASVRRLHPAVVAGTVHAGAEQGCRRCRAECPGVPADEVRRSGEESGNCASPRGVVPRQFAPLSGSGPATAFCVCRASRGLLQTQCRGYAPVHDQGFREESTVAWPHRKEHHHGRAAVPVGSAVRAGRPKPST